MKRTIADVKKEIEAKQKEIDNFELDNDDYVEQYDESLNSMHDSKGVDICGMTFEPCRALKELDETAYRCGLNDYVDGIDVEDDEKYKNLQEELEELEEELINLETK